MFENSVVPWCDTPNSSDIAVQGRKAKESDFYGAQGYLSDARTNIKNKKYQTNIGKVFVAGDMRLGQSFAVWNHKAQTKGNIIQRLIFLQKKERK